MQLTHSLMGKHERMGHSMVLTEKVREKVKKFVKKFMEQCGPAYVRSSATDHTMDDNLGMREEEMDLGGEEDMDLGD